MTQPETISTFEFFNKFPDEESARLFFEGRRWGGIPVCGHCGSSNVVECKDHRPMPYRCRDCRKHFSVRTGTVLAESRLPLQKWLLAIFMLTSARKGVPSTQMSRELGITQKSAWFLSQRIREVWLGSPTNPMSDRLQVGETYIGGSERNKHSSRKLRAGRGTVGKLIVIGGKDENGEVRASVIDDTKAKTLQGFVVKNLKCGSMVVTDNHAGYDGLEIKGYKHIKINHTIGEYVRNMAHTNGIESFWSLLKRGYYGVYHYMSKKHLNRYINEFAFRHNTRRLGTIGFIHATIERMPNNRLTYRRLTDAQKARRS